MGVRGTWKNTLALSEVLRDTFFVLAQPESENRDEYVLNHFRESFRVILAAPLPKMLATKWAIAPAINLLAGEKFIRLGILH